MQEQPHYKITADQAWAKMKPLLDQAMPVQESARRLPMFWWLATAVIVTGFVGVLGISLLSSDANTSADRKNAASTLSTEGEKSTKLWSNDQPQPQANIPNEEAKAGSETTIHTDDPIENLNDNQLKTIKSTNKSGSEKSSHQNKKPIQPEVIPMAMNDDGVKTVPSIPMTIDQEVADGSSNVSDYTSDDQLISSVVEPEVSMRTEIAMIEPIPTLDTRSSFAYDQRDGISYPSSTVKAKRIPSMFDVSASASSMFGQQGGIGYYGGAGVSMNISRKFSVTTAVGYFSYRPDASLFGSSLDQAEINGFNAIVNYDPTPEGIDTYVYEESINAAADYYSINPLIETIAQWQIDLGLQWKFSRRWYASAGAKFGFLANAVSQYPIFVNDPLGINSPGLRVGNSLNDYDVIRTNTTSLYAGIGYRLNTHFEVFGDWTHGLDQYLLNDITPYQADLSTGSRTDYIRGLNLGLRYTL